MKLTDKMLYELWYIFCAGGGPYYDIEASDKMSQEIQQNCTGEEFMAMVDLLVNIPDTIEYNGRKINMKEKHYSLEYELSQEFLGYIYEARFTGNKVINDHIIELAEGFPANTYLIDLIGCTSNLDFISLLIRICNKENQQKISNSIRSIIEMHYDRYGLTSEEAIRKMLTQNRHSVFYPDIVQGIEADREAVQKGILYSKG